MSDHKKIREEIINKAIEYYQARFVKPDFVAGKSKVNYAGRVFDHKEIVNAIEASLDFWLTEGRFSETFSE
jgi:CDP-6-deoxy-D-xylo-4-hexulose-3-dehydrase